MILYIIFGQNLSAKTAPNQGKRWDTLMLFRKSTPWSVLWIALYPIQKGGGTPVRTLLPWLLINRLYDGSVEALQVYFFLLWLQEKNLMLYMPRFDSKTKVSINLWDISLPYKCLWGFVFMSTLKIGSLCKTSFYLFDALYICCYSN